jgi:hypothetical protein
MTNELHEWNVKLRIRVQKDIEIQRTVQADHAGGAVQDVIDGYKDEEQWDASVVLEATVKPV